jgi:hypothetical protein
MSETHTIPSLWVAVLDDGDGPLVLGVAPTMADAKLQCECEYDLVTDVTDDTLDWTDHPGIGEVGRPMHGSQTYYVQASGPYPAC